MIEKESPGASRSVDPQEGRRTVRSFLEGLRGDLFSLFALATCCLCAGLVANQMRDHPLPLIYASKQDRLGQTLARLDQDQIPPPIDQTTSIIAPAEISQSPSMGIPRVIDLEEFEKLVQSKGGIVLDARPEIFHRLGHVPGALSLSREEFERDYARLRVALESSRDKAVAVYCSSASCEDSQMVAEALVKLGYRHLLVFKDGWSEWTHAGLPEEHS